MPTKSQGPTTQKAFFLAILAVFLPIAAVTAVLVYSHVRSEVMEGARQQAVLLLQRNLATHAYFAHTLKPSLFEDLRNATPEGYFNSAWMSSTFAVREIDKEFRKLSESNYYYKECAINARSPENEADPFEREFIREVNSDPTLQERASLREIDGEPYLAVLYRGERMEKACLRCHDRPELAPRDMVERYGGERSFGREEGEVVSAVSVRIPLSGLVEEATNASLALMGMLIGMLALSFGIMLVLNRRLVLAPLVRLTSQARAIASDPAKPGQEIPRPWLREFSELTESFNAMSASLHREFSERDVQIGRAVAEYEDSCLQLEEEIQRRGALEELLAKREETYRQMFDNAPLPYQSLDEQGDFLHVNNAWLKTMGYSADEVVGKWFGDFMDEEFRAHFDRNFPMFKHPCVIDGVEFKLDKKNGEHILVSFNGRVQTDEAGNFVRTHCIFRDVTETRRLEKDLREAKNQAEVASSAKSMFLANMSHEIRTPLNGILGMLQIVRETELEEEQREYIEVALASCNRLTRLLSDILDLSKIEAGAMRFIQEPFSPCDVMESVRNLFGPAANQAGIQLSVSCAEDVPARLEGDSSRLQQVLNNLVGNALKFTEKGRVDAEATLLKHSPDGTCRLLFTVRDTGKGIEPDVQDAIFNPFVQVDASSTRKHQGAGLGLSIVRRLVELMGGEISLESAPGEGTTFCISLPFEECGSHDAASGIAESKDESAEAAVSKVLVVEDDSVNRMAMTRLLQKLGCDARAVENGREAIDTLQHERFDIVFMDIQMPVLDGIAATMEIRNGKAGPDNAAVPIVALTAYAMAGDRERFLSAGMDEYLPKPVERDALLEVLTRISSGIRRG